MKPIKTLSLIVLSFLAQLFSGPPAFRTANNEGVAGTHKQATTKLPDAAWNSRHLLVQIGSDSNHVNLCNQASRPYGFTQDAPASAGDPIQVEFLSGHIGTCLMNATGPLAQDVGVFTCATPGYVSGLPNAAGTYWLVGHTKEATQETQDAEYLVEVEPNRPMKVVVDGNGNASCIVI
ncbi:MAG TPA: hypothetical protein VHY22_13450 [Chthoniobacteraceae bacterium]|nr:hypothetical protein [Chthoniobacteraceae bacterium]